MHPWFVTKCHISYTEYGVGRGSFYLFWTHTESRRKDMQSAAFFHGFQQAFLAFVSPEPLSTFVKLCKTLKNSWIQFKQLSYSVLLSSLSVCDLTVSMQSQSLSMRTSNQLVWSLWRHCHTFPRKQCYNYKEAPQLSKIGSWHDNLSAGALFQAPRGQMMPFQRLAYLSRHCSWKGVAEWIVTQVSDRVAQFAVAHLFPGYLVATESTHCCELSLRCCSDHRFRTGHPCTYCTSRLIVSQASGLKCPSSVTGDNLANRSWVKSPEPITCRKRGLPAKMTY